MRVLVTGMIAGMDDEPYLQQVVAMGRMEGLDIRYHNLVQRLQSTGGKKLHRLLGATNYLFEVLREREYGRIGFELLEGHCQDALLRVPATIEWNRINIKLKDHKHIAHFLRPDIVVTLIDAEWNISQRLRQPEEGDEFMGRIRQQHHTFHEILSWMNEEVSLSEDWARFFGVPHFVIPIGQHPLSLYKLVKCRDVPSFYVSYSMTHADPPIRREINDVTRRLTDYGLVIDPQAIEIHWDFENDADREATMAFTVHRDLHWYVGKVDAVVAIHPYAERPPLSTGMMDELGHARDYLKKRYMIFPPKSVSPFTSDSYIEKGRIFHNAEEFFLCLEAEGYRPLAFSDQVKNVPWKGAGSLD